MDNWSLWARDFAKSPGAAAFAALIAAGIAFVGIGRQVAVSRSVLEHQRDAASTTSWWQTFEWASSRALPSSDKEHPLPDSVTISTLVALLQAATKEVQEAACREIIDVLASRVALSEANDKESSEITEPEASAAFNALASYVKASNGTSAASPEAEAAVYERNVLYALTQLRSDIRAFREPLLGDARTDAVVEVAGSRVAVDVSYARTVQVVRARIQSIAERRRERALNPVVVVSRFPSPFTREQEAEMGVFVAQWNSPNDNRRLLEALGSASTLSITET
ncbi:hypothetical protein [Clavibacter sp. Sh2126]|uniref:hypothetical protein n=1 Tax=Clavibacter sp. Sh2126 TaxID=3397678 RepID=UPI0039E037C1